MANRNKAKGSANERAVAAFWGVKRAAGVHGSDIETEHFSIETKTKPKRGPNRIPSPIVLAVMEASLNANPCARYAILDYQYAFVLAAWEQAKRNAQTCKLPMVQFHTDGERHEWDICFLRPCVAIYARDLREMVTLHGGVKLEADKWGKPVEG